MIATGSAAAGRARQRGPPRRAAVRRHAVHHPAARRGRRHTSGTAPPRACPAGYVARDRRPGHRAARRLLRDGDVPRPAGHRHRHPRPIRCGRTTAMWPADSASRLLVDADLLAAAEGARLVGDVLRQPRAPRQRRVAADRNRGRHRPHRHRTAARAIRRCGTARPATSAILRAIPDWMFLTTVDGVFLDYHAKDVAALHAAARGVPRPANVRDVLPPHIADALAQAFARAAASDEPEKIEYTLGADDSERFYEAMHRPLRRRQDPQHRPGHHRPQARRAGSGRAPAGTGAP